jgi:hypothetical protein
MADCKLKLGDIVSVDVNASLEKIVRARQKLIHAKSLFDKWLVGGPRHTVKTLTHGNMNHEIVCVENSAPDDITWEIVEAVGHLRSALDKALVAVVKFNGRGISGVGFPFGGIGSDGNPENFPSERHKHLQKKLSDCQWQLILDQKPYPDGNDLLWGINEIANEDKHRINLVKLRPLIAPVDVSMTGGVISGIGGGVISTGGNEYDHLLSDPELEKIAVSYSCGTGSVRPQIDIDITIEIAFGDVAPVSNKEVFSTLNCQIEIVKSIVEQLAATQ